MPSVNRPRLRILGTRGVPAAHGGFETFAERLALYLVQKGWDVTVYCQADGTSAITSDEWRGIHRHHIPVQQTGPLATVVFDWKSTLHASRSPGLVLTLGYNTALFCIAYRLKGLPNLINMDGIEWKRAKWTTPLRIWFWLNERFGCWLGNHLIADHPEIMRHLESHTSAEKLTMIPYGADRIEAADSSMLDKFGLSPKGYAILIARAEPENSILEVVRAFSRAKRNIKLVILGTYDPSHAYQKRVLESAGAEVMFVGAIYDTRTVAALRYFSRLYIHGHQVGGTNPSLVEALGAGNAVLAHNNQFNRWVAGDGARYFSDENECAGVLDQILNNEAILQTIRTAATTRYQERFTWDRVLQEYESLLLQWLPAPSQSREQTGE